MSPRTKRDTGFDKAISLKLSADDDLRLTTEAEHRGVSKSELVREAVSAYLVFDRDEPEVGSFLAVARDLAGCIDAEDDLATDPRHLDGYGS